jgi:hemerythrin-like domain-containing protein
LGFLKQSISQDHEAASIGTGLKRRISSIFARLASEGEQQASLIKKLEDALKNAKKAAEESQRKAEEATK